MVRDGEIVCNGTDIFDIFGMVGGIVVEFHIDPFDFVTSLLQKIGYDGRIDSAAHRYEYFFHTRKVAKKGLSFPK
ncbi:hypothetical protein D3C81_2272680 [compost metagenome]